jgi:hypothetical protein
MAEGLTERRAQEAAIAGFGPVHAIVYAHQTRHGKAAAMLADLASAGADGCGRFRSAASSRCSWL